jgi:hypothetical protein
MAATLSGRRRACAAHGRPSIRGPWLGGGVSGPRRSVERGQGSVSVARAASLCQWRHRHPDAGTGPRYGQPGRWRLRSPLPRSRARKRVRPRRAAGRCGTRPRHEPDVEAAWADPLALTGRQCRRAINHKRTVSIRHAMCRPPGEGGHERVVGADRPGRLVRCFASGGAVARPGSQARLTGPGSPRRANRRETSWASRATQRWAARRLAASKRGRLGTWSSTARRGVRMS